MFYTCNTTCFVFVVFFYLIGGIRSKEHQGDGFVSRKKRVSAILPVIQKPILNQVRKYAVGAAGFVIGTRYNDLIQKAKEVFSDKSNTTTTTPRPMLRRNNQVARNRRAIGAVVGRFVAKYTAWLAVMVAAGVTSSAAEQYFIYHFNEKAMESMKRRTIDCTSNNFGCLNNLCWTNCGPRLTSNDWCIASNGVYTNVTTFDVQTNHTTTRKKMHPAVCEHDDDCEACFRCQKSCIGDESFSPLSFSNEILIDPNEKRLNTNTNVYASMREFP